jgi:thioester reductase-like protein
MRLAIVGSDAWYVADHNRARRVLGDATRLINSYGLTETTIDSSFFEGETSSLPETGLAPIGRPFANVRLYVLDAHTQPAPIGVPGELYVGGDGVSRGYVNAELNAERFVEDPFCTSARLCRTGDRARWRPDGQVEFLGRADNQVKIRGFRVEPGEVEEVLGEHPQLAQAAVAAHERTPGDVRLVAYVVGKQAAPDFAELKRHLARRLPDYMMPSAFVALDALPTTASGKVDRKRLPAPDWSSATAQREFVEPRTETERQLAAIWRVLLGVDRVGSSDDFFALGGHSLLALRLMARIRQAFSVEVPLVRLFMSPTVADLAAVIDGLVAGTGFAALPQEDLDWEAESALDETIRATPDLQPPAENPSRVLLTGATGFLGAYLLRELLQRTSAEVHCLVRARSAEEGNQRIAGNLRQYDLDIGEDARRVVPVCGDLEQPQLGLSPQEFDRLAASIDAVYHNGANVNFVYPYQLLRAANVGGTVEVLRLAARTRLKPVHFVSTVSVFDAPECAAAGTIDEDQPLPAVRGLRGGYAQSKCIAEKLVRTAGRRGIPVAVYRPGRVTADSETGAESLADYTTLLLRLCIEMKSAPASEDEVDMTPVDYVAQAVVGLAQRPESVGRTFHLVNPRLARVRDVYRAIRDCGYDLQEVPLDAWRAAAIQWGVQSQDRSFAAFSHWLTFMAPLADHGHMVPAVPSESTASQPPTMVCDKTLQDLLPLGVTCPVVDVERLKKQVLFLARKQLVTPPVGNALRGVPDERPVSAARNATEGVPYSHDSAPRHLVPLRAADHMHVVPAARPLFLVHGLGGHAAPFLSVARGLADGRPVYGLQAQGLELGQEPHDKIETMAACYVSEIREVQPRGPYLLGGWSMGGMIALEAARQLLAAGQAVALVAMLDTYFSLSDLPAQDFDEPSVLRRIASQLNVPLGELKNLPLQQQWDRIAELADRAGGIGIAEIRRLAATCKAHLLALSRYEPQPYPGRCVLFPVGGQDRRWQAICPNLCIEPMPGDHFSILRAPHVQLLAERLDRFLQESDGEERTAQP